MVIFRKIETEVGQVVGPTVVIHVCLLRYNKKDVSSVIYSISNM